MEDQASRIWDVIVVGAGSAGSAVAYQTARSGLWTLVLERRTLEDAGARWVNAVPGWAFDEAEVLRPVSPECRGTTSRFHLFAGWGPASVTIEPRDILDVDMRFLIRRLRQGAKDAGAIFEEQVRVLGPPDGPQLHTSHGPRRGRVIIDATGVRAHLTRESSHKSPHAPSDICAAAQAVYRVSDPAGAHRFMADHGANHHEPVCFAGVAGGFSVVVVRLEGEDEVSILTGSRPSEGFAAGGKLLADFVAREPWIGERLFGGQAPIPLSPRRGSSVHQSAAGPIIQLGDAAGHVFSAHGSGIALHLVAGKMLADALVSNQSASAAAYAFDQAWRKRFGPVLAASDLFRRASQQLSPRVMHTLITRGVLRPKMMRIGLEQRLPDPLQRFLAR